VKAAIAAFIRQHPIVTMAKGTDRTGSFSSQNRGAQRMLAIDAKKAQIRPIEMLRRFGV